MVLINGVKYACERCIRGHRVTTCTHTDQPLTMIKPKGRPASQCLHCREQRKLKNLHINCSCNKLGKSPGQHLANCYKNPNGCTCYQQHKNRQKKVVSNASGGGNSNANSNSNSNSNSATDINLSNSNNVITAGSGIPESEKIGNGETNGMIFDSLTSSIDDYLMNNSLLSFQKSIEDRAEQGQGQLPAGGFDNFDNSNIPNNSNNFDNSSNNYSSNFDNSITNKNNNSFNNESKLNDLNFSNENINDLNYDKVDIDFPNVSSNGFTSASESEGPSTNLNQNSKNNFFNLNDEPVNSNINSNVNSNSNPNSNSNSTQNLNQGQVIKEEPKINSPLNEFPLFALVGSNSFDNSDSLPMTSIPEDLRKNLKNNNHSSINNSGLNNHTNINSATASNNNHPYHSSSNRPTRPASVLSVNSNNSSDFKADAFPPTLHNSASTTNLRSTLSSNTNNNINGNGNNSIGIGRSNSVNSNHRSNSITNSIHSHQSFHGSTSTLNGNIGGINNGNGHSLHGLNNDIPGILETNEFYVSDEEIEHFLNDLNSKNDFFK